MGPQNLRVYGDGRVGSLNLNWQPSKRSQVLSVRIGTQFNVWCYVTSLGNVNMILGTPWMRKHKLQVDWGNNRLLFPMPDTIETVRVSCMSLEEAHAYTREGAELFMVTTKELEDPSRLINTTQKRSSYLRSSAAGVRDEGFTIFRDRLQRAPPTRQ
jgi:hypothetical protein